MSLKIDAAVRAFRKYFKYSAGFENMPYFDVCERLRGACANDAEAIRVLTVYDTLLTLRAQGKAECAEAVSFVYFANNGRLPRSNEISFRVRRFAIEKAMDERTVYRRIAEAKDLYLALLDKKLAHIENKTEEV